jgi:hypothetical protein
MYLCRAAAAAAAAALLLPLLPFLRRFSHQIESFKSPFDIGNGAFFTSLNKKRSFDLSIA